MSVHKLETSRRSLEQVLRKAHLGVALIAVLMVGMTLMVAGLIAVRIYSEENLLLVARSMSYTVEAAVVFGDYNAAADALNIIGANEDISEATVYARDGRTLAQWKDPRRGPQAWLERKLVAPLLPEPLLFPIMRDNSVIGQVRLAPDGRGLLVFLISALAGVSVCMALAIVVALLLARRMQAGIVVPLRDLANVAHRVRRERDFALRAPPARIAEFNELNGDFNALLDELEDWHRHLEKENASLEHRANHDSLTGLSNRAFLEDQLEQAVEEARLSHGRVGVMFLDIDHFKQINDEHGHAAGDSVLVAIAARMKSQLREGDLVARLGGDEFAILLQSLRHSDDALHIADKILGEMRVPIALPEGGHLIASLSIGVAVYPEHGADPQAMLAAADRAMYQSKQKRGTRHLAA